VFIRPKASRRSGEMKVKFKVLQEIEIDYTNEECLFDVQTRLYCDLKPYLQVSSTAGYSLQALNIVDVIGFPIIATAKKCVGIDNKEGK
jgi:hypothetical protein